MGSLRDGYPLSQEHRCVDSPGLSEDAHFPLASNAICSRNGLAMPLLLNIGGLHCLETWQGSAALIAEGKECVL